MPPWLAFTALLVSASLFLAFVALAIFSLVKLFEGQIIIGLCLNALSFWGASLAMRLWRIGAE
jgi:hypothetical protein